MKRVLMTIMLATLLLSCTSPTPLRRLTQSEMEDLEDYCYDISDTSKEYADCMSTQELPSPKAKILNINHKRDSIGNFIIIGEVKNNGQVRIRFLKVSCKGYDSGGNLVDAHTTYAEPSHLKPDDDAIFTCYLDETKSIESYKCDPFID